MGENGGGRERGWTRTGVDEEWLYDSSGGVVLVVFKHEMQPKFSKDAEEWRPVRGVQGVRRVQGVQGVQGGRGV